MVKLSWQMNFRRLWDIKTDQHMDKDVYRRKLADLTQTYDQVLARLEDVIAEDK